MRSDSPEVFIALLDDAGKELASRHWQAGRELSNQLHQTITDLCDQHSKSLTDISGIVAYKGPGSYTGLRISTSVANALAYSLSVPVVGVRGDMWLVDGIGALNNTLENTAFIAPEYGSEVRTTKPRK